MMIALTENPAVIAPRKTLTRQEQDALLKVGFYRYQRRVSSDRLRIGTTVFAIKTVDGLKRHKLVRGEVPSLSPTEAGLLAIERLKGTGQ